MNTNYPYRTHPVHHIEGLAIDSGHDTLATRIQTYCAQALERNQPPIIIVEGYIGVEWELFIEQLRLALARLSLDASFISTEQCLLPASRIQDMLGPTLTDDPVFGRVFRGHLTDLWDAASAQDMRISLATTSSHPVIVYGYGASLLVDHGGLLIYLDVPKDRVQQLAAQGSIHNVGAAAPDAFPVMYKRMYSVDWPILNRIKRATLSYLDIFVDATESTAPRLIEGNAFRSALHELSLRPFRVKPWFAPGPWGGQWMKERFGLPDDKPNYAWSFELIAPENGLLLGDHLSSIECAFDYLLWHETDAVLGERVAARYGSYFPIRFDYLDTMQGTNLSCQVHPRLDYIRDEFGEPFTQDETYYIVTCEPGARVFLGLQDDVDMTRFQNDAVAARDHAVPFEISDHVHSVPSAPHKLFFIPSGTVHCSGANNLVLEISATPYIYTFKIYDYLRNDLSGKLRHVHLEHAFANIDATRRGNWVERNLCPEPLLLRQEEGGTEYQLGSNDRLFFAIHRLEFTTTLSENTRGAFLLLNMVEGECCEIIAEGREPLELHFAESVVIPASLGSFYLRNTGQGLCKLVKAFVK